MEILAFPHSVRLLRKRNQHGPNNTVATAQMVYRHVLLDRNLLPRGTGLRVRRTRYKICFGRRAPYAACPGRGFVCFSDGE